MGEGMPGPAIGGNGGHGHGAAPGGYGPFGGYGAASGGAGGDGAGGGAGAGGVGSPGPGGAGASSKSTTKYSVTVGEIEPDAVTELGVVGDDCWLQDTIVSANRAMTTKGAIVLGEVNDMGDSYEPIRAEADRFREARRKR